MSNRRVTVPAAGKALSFIVIACALSGCPPLAMNDGGVDGGVIDVIQRDGPDDARLDGVASDSGQVDSGAVGVDTGVIGADIGALVDADVVGVDAFDAGVGFDAGSDGGRDASSGPDGSLPLDAGRDAALGTDGAGGSDGDVDAGSAPDSAGGNDAGIGSDAGSDAGADAGADAFVGCTAVSNFTDNFTRADAPNLGNCWVGYSALVPDAVIRSGSACGDVQSLGVMRVNMAPTTIQYDWVASSSTGLETNAIIALESAGTPGGLFIAGIDGGHTPPRLSIRAVGGAMVAGPMDVAVTPGTTYRLTATFNPSGAITVTLATASTMMTLGTLSGAVAAGLNFNRAGFIVGRNADAMLTCVDNFSIMQ